MRDSRRVLPVWSLLQARDFLNSLLLYLGLAAAYVGLFVLQPEFVAPAIETHPEGAPSIFPFVFIVIACGAASGFHALVSSGTTAKQINRETDARFVAYGGMVGRIASRIASRTGVHSGIPRRFARVASCVRELGGDPGRSSK